MHVRIFDQIKKNGFIIRKKTVFHKKRRILKTNSVSVKIKKVQNELKKNYEVLY